MFGLSFTEIVIIFIVAVLVLKPEDIPEIMRKTGNIVAKIRRWTNDITGQIDGPIEEIIDLEGNKQPRYDVSEIHKQRNSDNASE